MVGIPMDSGEELKNLAESPFEQEISSFGRSGQNFIPVAESVLATISPFSPLWMVKFNLIAVEGVSMLSAIVPPVRDFLLTL
jgi:hypothetical protein